MLAKLLQPAGDLIKDTWQSTLWDVKQRIAPGRDRRYVPVGMRRQIMRRDKATCQICGKAGNEETGPDGRSWHIDHVMPIAKNGQTARYNLALSCATCNQRKAAK
jgi:5-methylcytosine-specific restriction endonuclease McrA